MKKKIWYILFVFFAALFLFSGFMLIRYWRESTASAASFENAAALIAPSDEGAEQSAQEKYAALYEKNPDFLGWISIEGTRVDYPVMQTKDRPNYYLRRNFEGQPNRHGVPYAAEGCDPGCSDNTILYGHNMNDGSMFADLCLYQSRDFYETHQTICFDTLAGYGTYRIIAVFQTTAGAEDDFAYDRFIQAASDAEFRDFIARCKALSLYETGVGADYGDKLLTLSTCEYSRKNGRMVVVAKKIS